MSNFNFNQIKSNSIALSQFSQYSLTKNIEAIKGGVSGNGDSNNSNFIGEYINQ